jgi:DNA-directed RNA polymerase subunit RPC12/RpoP
MTEIVFRCTHCSSSLQIDGVHAGRNISCPHCRQSIIVPFHSRVAPVRVATLSPSRPTFLTVLGLLSVVLGCLGVLFMPLVLTAALQPADAFSLQATPKHWQVVSAVFMPLPSLWLLIMGIGLLKLRKWARIGSVAYGWFAVVFGTIQLCIVIAEFFANLSHQPLVHSHNAVSAATTTMLGGVLSGMVALIFPIVLIVLLSRRQALTACSR